MAADTREHLFANNAFSRLLNAIDDAQTTLQVVVADAASFPSPGVDQIFKLTVINFTNGDREIMHVTERTDNSMTVERAQEDTTALAFPAGAAVQLRMTAETLHYLQNLLPEA